jgi:predicted negative regulator of RcsB-dependent stress response
MDMKSLLIVTDLFAATTAAHAQAQLKLPEQSPAASVTQTVGLTEITVNYHRPAVAGRAIWGELVPYNQPWRAGANDNTTIKLSSDVKVGGKPLRAGTYGVHMIPTAKDWTIAFSTMTTAWGSFTYDPKEDAQRITVTPRATATPEERLAYRFDDPSDTKATLVLAWEKLAVPIAIEVETPKVVMASIRGQLRGVVGFSWQAYNQAAVYWVKNGGPLDEAMKLADRSIAMTATYPNQMTRAAILEKQGNAKAAAELRAKILPLAGENDLNQIAYQLIGEKKLDEAAKVLQQAAEKFASSWNAQDSYGEVLALKGDKPGAIAAYSKALALVKDPVQKKRIEDTLAKLKS